MPQELCLKCGLCCNGVLFRDVELQPGDGAGSSNWSVLRVRARPSNACPGIKAPAGKLLQPCGALGADNCCQVYAQRPARCREFECVTFQAVRRGELTSEQALRIIGATVRRVQRIERLLKRLGDTRPEVPLAVRFRRIQRHLESAPRDVAAAELFQRLSLEMHQLHLLLARHFYSASAA